MKNSPGHVQTELPRELELEGPDICAWCGEPSTGYIEIQPARYGVTKQIDPVTRKRVRYLRKRAIIAKVCSYHSKNLKLRET